MAYTIEDIPPQHVKMKQSKMPFDQTQIGQCFRVPNSDYAIATIRSACIHWSGKLGRKFTCKAIEDNLVLVACVGECEIKASKKKAKPVKSEPAPLPAPALAAATEGWDFPASPSEPAEESTAAEQEAAPCGKCGCFHAEGWPCSA